jgi:LEA14-like dessication related protein
MTKTAKLLDAFVSGDQLTTKQIKARYKLVNPSEAIRTLRESGYAIYANETKMSNGKVATKYRLGAPSRRMVAAAAKVAGASIFSH